MQTVGRLVRAGVGLDELCDRVLSTVPRHPEDDVALIALRAHPEDLPRPREAGPAVVPELPGPRVASATTTAVRRKPVRSGAVPHCDPRGSQDTAAAVPHELRARTGGRLTVRTFTLLSTSDTDMLAARTSDSEEWRLGNPYRVGELVEFARGTDWWSSGSSGRAASNEETGPPAAGLGVPVVVLAVSSCPTRS